jgi:hypothetical protein
MQTKTATKSSHEFTQNNKSFNEASLALIWAFLSFISLLFYAFNF